jgi:hypothetical protein
MQLSAIRTEVRTRSGLNSSDANFTDAILTTLINASLRQISIAEDWPWLQVTTTANTVAGTETISLAANCRKVVQMQYEHRDLRYVQFRDRHMYYALTGYPSVFSESAGSYYIWPTPDAVYTIQYSYYRTTETALSADGDTPLLPDWAIDLLISKVCSLVARRNRDKDLENVFYAEYRQVLADIKDDIMRVTQGKTPKRIGNRLAP